MAEKGESLDPKDVFEEEANEAFRALTASPTADSDDFVLSPARHKPSFGDGDSDSFGLDENDFKLPQSLPADEGNLEFQADEDEEAEKLDIVAEGRVSPYTMKRPRVVVVYSSASGLECRSKLITKLLNDLPDVFCAPDAVCTAVKRVGEYCGGHPAESLNHLVFEERWGAGQYFVTYAVPMRVVPSSAASPTANTAVGSPVRGESCPVSPASTTSQDTPETQPRQRRKLPSVPSNTSAKPSSASPLKPKVPVNVQVGIVKESLDHLSQSRTMCAVLSLGVDAAISVAKSTDRYAMVFLCLAVSKEDARPFSPEHTVILAPDEDLAFPQFRNAALVAASKTSARTLKPSSQSQVALEARTEWESVATVRLETKFDPDSSFQAAQPPQPVAAVSFAEVLAFFQSKQQSLQEKFGMFQPLKKPGLFTTKLKTSLTHERDMVYTIANTPFDNSEPLHFRVLQTIYKKLTGNVIDCPRFGSHWESIGFQGTDPATDLRATGFLSLMHLLHLVTSPDLLPLAHNVYKLSKDEEQNFPMAVLSINLTLMSLQALQCGAISKMCNKRQQVISCINDLYVACLYRLYRVWKTGRMTIVDSGSVLKDLQDYVTDHPRQLMSELKEYRAAQGSSSTPV